MAFAPLPIRGFIPTGLGMLGLVLAGCGSFPIERPAGGSHFTADVAPAPHTLTPIVAPGKFATRRGYYVVYHDFELDPHEPLFAELDALPEQVGRELNLPLSDGVVQVFLFDTQERYERFMHRKYPELPKRRAYFLSQPRAGGYDELKIYTWMGDHLTTDLRHELTHALLRGALKEVPLWLDEGLAGYFELLPAQAGINSGHLEALLRPSFRPNLARLEKFTQVAQMEKPEYREAWAWVYFMLHSGPATQKVLHDYLQALRTNPNPGPLLPRLREVVPDPDQALTNFLLTVEVPTKK
ncbi:MAG: hypothetical protein RMJ56_03800 [Gemmataceae bacterium]|nr:DUF1570 domain-containing protein [Gemmata sp.]MDW8196713.1 hypothetical protein [Gemmataceae bacterium]